ncbi:MAG: hypothetical protein ABJA71_11715, partial [Ginsengibacter sp.]
WLINSVNKPNPDQQNKLSEDFIEQDSSTKMQISRQPAKNFAVRNQAKKILPPSFENRSEKKSLSRQDNAETILTKLLLKKKVSNIPANRKSIMVEPLAILAQGKNLRSKNREVLKGKSKIISDQIYEINRSANNINTDSLIAKVIIDSANKDKEAKTVMLVSKQAKKGETYKTKKAWKWGLNFAAGISGVPNKFLGSLDKSFAAADALYSSGRPQSNFAPLPSKIKSSGGVIAGFYVEKNISKKKMITAGINYKLFSAINKVGEKNDSSQQYSLNNAVNNYHHYYHFIELPVSLKVQISSKNIPLFWDAGVSISQLVSSNALQFNTNSIGYYHNNALFNKSQIGFNTGFSASLFANRNTSALIGPYIYYGTTKIAEEGLYKNQHFTFIGLRSQILFKK